jgi:putative transposase
MNNLFKNRYRIDSARLKRWDYSSNANYFVTICTKNRSCFFSHIENEEIFLSDIGLVAEKYWKEIPCHFPFVKLDEYVVMPNHIHGIITIVETQHFASLHQNQYRFGPQSKNLASIVRGFKVGVKKWATENKELFNVRNYISNNPLKWEEDEEFVRM